MDVFTFSYSIESDFGEVVQTWSSVVLRVSGQLCFSKSINIVWEVQNLPIVLNLRRVLVDLRGQVIKGRTQFMPLASCNWRVSCRAEKLINMWMQFYRTSSSYSHTI